METLELLGVALGLATLAGINLYLTVFVTGLAVQQGWIALHPPYEQLAVLGDPIIVTIAGALFVLEFFADKVPWVDSLWDSVHTLIRPIGGALLSISVLGEANPVYDVVVGLLGGGMALTTHGLKSGTRLLANASPEPFTNIGLSVAEDAAVLGGLALIYNFPVAALVVAMVVVGLALWLVPRIFTAARAMFWFVWRRILHATGAAEGGVLSELPADLEIELAGRRDDAPLRWAAPCVTGSGKYFAANRFCWLLVTEGDGGGLDLARKGAEGLQLQPVPLAGQRALHRRGLVCDRVVLYDAEEGRRQTLQFDRSRRALAVELTRWINERRERAVSIGAVGATAS